MAERHKELRPVVKPGRVYKFGADFQERDNPLWLCLEFLSQQCIDYALQNKTVFLLSGPCEAATAFQNQKKKKKRKKNEEPLSAFASNISIIFSFFFIMHFIIRLFIFIFWNFLRNKCEGVMGIAANN